MIDTAAANYARVFILFKRGRTPPSKTTVHVHFVHDVYPSCRGKYYVANVVDRAMSALIERDLRIIHTYVGFCKYGACDKSAQLLAFFLS